MGNLSLTCKLEFFYLSRLFRLVTTKRRIKITPTATAKATTKGQGMATGAWLDEESPLSEERISIGPLSAMKED